MKQEHLKRVRRLLKIAIEVRSMPYQIPSRLWNGLGISKSQFYKDKKALEELGFEFSYDHKKGAFHVNKDPYLPVEDLTLSERLALVMAFRQLSAAGDYILTFEGFNAAKKLAAELPSPFKESLFQDIVLNEGFGCAYEIMEKLRKAVKDRQRIILSYQIPENDAPVPHEVEPYSLFFKRRSLYLDGYSWTEKGIRMYRLNRIKKVQFTPYGFDKVREDYDFGARHKNAFSVFAGDKTEHVVIRFDRKIRPYIEESLWHHSQNIIKEDEGSVLFEADVAYPREMMWWAFRWGAGAEILEPDWLRKEAEQTLREMCRLYGISS